MKSILVEGLCFFVFVLRDFTVETVNAHINKFKKILVSYKSKINLS